jgi:hypothetical protein
MTHPRQREAAGEVYGLRQFVPPDLVVLSGDRRSTSDCAPRWKREDRPQWFARCGSTLCFFVYPTWRLQRLDVL